MELDSLCLQSSRVPRKKLLAPWRLINVKLKSKCSKSEAIEEISEYTASDLSKAGPSEDNQRDRWAD